MREPSDNRMRELPEARKSTERREMRLLGFSGLAVPNGVFLAAQIQMLDGVILAVPYSLN